MDIPHLYRLDEQGRYLPGDVTPGCEWVLDGEGWATRKVDGVGVRLEGDGSWQVRVDDEWTPAAGTGFAALIERALRTHDAAIAAAVEAGEIEPGSEDAERALEPGTFELAGPGVAGNPENLAAPQLYRHDSTLQPVVPPGVPLTYGAVHDALLHLAQRGWEGIVWHGPGGRMAQVVAARVPLDT